MVHLLESNIGMGLDHQWSPREILRSAGAFFLARDPEIFRKYAEVQSYCRYIESQNPDIVFLTEVCGEDQKNDICNFLESKGYHIQLMRAFELHNMDVDSHRFLYNIIAARTPIATHYEFQSSIESERVENLYSYLRMIEELHNPERGPYILKKMKKFTGGILDGAGAHCEIGGIHFWLLHAHATSSSVIEKLRDSLPKGSPSLLWGDFNVTLEAGRTLAGERFSYIGKKERTFPYYGQNGGIFSQFIDRSAKRSSRILANPDQFYWNGDIHQVSTRVLWPKETGLKSDHAVTHVHLAE